MTANFPRFRRAFSYAPAPISAARKVLRAGPSPRNRMSTGTAITGSGVQTPTHVVENEELCGSFNTWVRRENERCAEEIANGITAKLEESSPDFVYAVSGIRRRRMVDRSGVLDPSHMVPRIPDRSEDELSVQAELGLGASQRAIEAAGREGRDIDLVIVG